MKQFGGGLTLVIFSLCYNYVYSAIEEHRVASLPGYPYDLPSAHYSGLLPVGNISGVPGHLHYWFIESTNDPVNDPVVLWLNGGPGSSSLIGLLTENGQLMTNDDSLTSPIDGIPQLFLNSYAWTTMSNVIYLESPKGVGFSYCDNVNKSTDCINTDESTAQDSYEFLINFFAGFPEYKSNKFYITGESYAGIYIPMLMNQIDNDSLQADINLVGAAIGNGCWGNDIGTCDFSSGESMHIMTDFLYGHGMISQVLYKELQVSCGDWNRITISCGEKLLEGVKQMGFYDIYNIYDECGRDTRRRLRSKHSHTLMDVMKELSNKTLTVETLSSFTMNPSVSQALNDYICGSETAMDQYLAEPSVADALHVSLGTTGMMYQKTASNVLPLYQELISKYQILIYSGDVDACVPYVGTEQWTRNLGYEVVNDWHQWFSKPDDVHGYHKAGYAITYDKFQFITINGAGHMVPRFQPVYALTMFEKFLKNELF